MYYGGRGGEMNQALYAHMNNKRKKILKKKKKRVTQKFTLKDLFYF
jgi:hypothetical protein